MAGIGFVLRKLVRKGSLGESMMAYFHATLATCGAWLFTVIALAIFFLLFKTWPSILDVEIFRSVILYNYSFSLVLSSPVAMVATRVLADQIYEKKIDEGPGLMLGGLLVLFLFGLPVSTFFYFGYANLTFNVAILAVINFLIIDAIWLLSIFITALQYYFIVTITFIVGLFISLVLSTVFAYQNLTDDGVFNMLLGFTLGLAFILSSLIALVFVEYPRVCKKLFKFMEYWRKYWEIVVGGTCYNIAIWIDKWIMWFAPERELLPNNLILFPDYDVPMFVAYLTIVPAMAMFLISKETSFFEKYLLFFQDILKHAALKKILSNQNELIRSFIDSGLSLILLQVSICAVVLMISPVIFTFLGMNFLQLGVFHYGVLGAMFQVLALFLTIFISYLNYQRGVFYIQFLFMATNGLFTWITLQMGFQYYGYGYFLSTLVTFFAAAIITERYVRQLPYHSFITTNTSVQKQS